MNKKTAKTVLCALVIVSACCAIWLGYWVLHSRKPKNTGGVTPLANNPNARPSDKPVRWTLSQRLPIRTPHENIQQELKKCEAQVKRNPRDPDAHFYYADALDEVGSSEAALEQYRLALKFPPNRIGRAYLYRGLGMALEKKGDIDGALAAMRKSIVSWPVKHDVSRYVSEREILGLLIEEKGDYQGALQYWKDLMAVAKFPEKCREHYDRIRQFLDTGQQ